MSQIRVIQQYRKNETISTFAVVNLTEWPEVNVLRINFEVSYSNARGKQWEKPALQTKFYRTKQQKI